MPLVGREGSITENLRLRLFQTWYSRNRIVIEEGESLFRYLIVMPLLDRRHKTSQIPDLEVPMKMSAATSDGAMLSIHGSK